MEGKGKKSERKRKNPLLSTYRTNTLVMLMDEGPLCLPPQMPIPCGLKDAFSSRFALAPLVVFP